MGGGAPWLRGPSAGGAGAAVGAVLAKPASCACTQPIRPPPLPCTLRAQGHHGAGLARGGRPGGDYGAARAAGAAAARAAGAARRALGHAAVPGAAGPGAGGRRHARQVRAGGRRGWRRYALARSAAAAARTLERRRTAVDSSATAALRCLPYSCLRQPLTPAPPYLPCSPPATRHQLADWRHLQATAGATWLLAAPLVCPEDLGGGRLLGAVLVAGRGEQPATDERWLQDW